MNPRHFREDTADQMVAAGERAGLTIDHLKVRDHFARFSPAGRLYDAVTAILPAGFRQGLTVVYRHP